MLVNPVSIEENYEREIDSVTEIDRCAQHTPRGWHCFWNLVLLLGLHAHRGHGFVTGIELLFIFFGR